MKRLIIVAAVAALSSSVALAGNDKAKGHQGEHPATQNAASSEAPGQRAKASETSTDNGKNFAPGQEAKDSNDAATPGASEHAPGQMKKN